ncbi:MAG: hypothetical protein AB7P40_02345 [Chloroflexota bacterium]
MKRSLRAPLLTIGIATMLSLAALTTPPTGAFAQAVPSPVASPAAPVVVPISAPAGSPAAPKPAVPAAASPVASPAAARPAPRAGGIPMELAWPMMAGGAAAIGAGAMLLRRGKR